ncbi:hypothetical protein CCS77_0235 [Campylobacter concisus]|uniref:Uncharacterized protein n=1 Tax=Campylobacter concisus TaxID=199 RepID=A0A2R4NXZ9_9BACT|nr:hypothetical protein CCS77_0235 [Campylobacter concisus]
MTEGKEPRIKILEFLSKIGLKECVWLMFLPFKFMNNFR